MERIWLAKKYLVPLLALSVGTMPALGQQISDSALQQMRDILAIKTSLKPHQRKVSSALLFEAMKARGQALPSLENDLPLGDDQSGDGNVTVDIKVRSVAVALRRLALVGGSEVYTSVRDGMIRASLPLQSVETLAESPAVQLIEPASQGHTNLAAALRDPFTSPTVPDRMIRDQERARRFGQQTSSALPLLASNGNYPALHSLAGAFRISPFIGSLTSQGYIAHTANKAVALGIDGTGVKVGVMSDSATPAEVGALIASGDLPPDVVVVPGQAGDPNGSNEGTAMMEIVHDLAPGAKLFFATAASGATAFANNIRTLRFVYGCDIIVDDYSYFAEPAFQDGPIAQAVNDVTADGALYFSSAANSGNLSNGTSGTWEGDFVDGGDPGVIIDTREGKPVTAHNFGTVASPILYDTLTSGTTFIGLHWSDAYGQSGNDYDLFLLNSTGTAVIAASVTVQNGTQNPFESVFSSTGFPAGSRIVVVRSAGAVRGLHIDTERATVTIGTSGATFGHNAGLNTVSMAATSWNSAREGVRPFTGFANRVELFSSDGPRKIFYQPNGTPITPGNFLFATAGGQTLVKPDLTAADGVTTRTPGFNPFYGTSAAAPHAAAIAALVKSANLLLTSSQIKTIMTNTALDTMVVGIDRDSGYGIAMALPAVEAALAGVPTF